ncbi:hypothetical protein AL036_11805 [Salipiger aestuarii]|nr:hypothetical protein AL036_11805 [Salipiger aestuarii]KAB2542266.1 hypothetical protein AL035_07845 [Salipiger aestuarii]
MAAWTKKTGVPDANLTAAAATRARRQRPAPPSSRSSNARRLPDWERIEWRKLRILHLGYTVMASLWRDAGADPDVSMRTCAARRRAARSAQ